MFQADPYGFLALTAFVMCIALAVVLFRVSTSGSVGRKLSLLLVVEGVTMMSTGYIDLFLTEAVKAHPFYPAWFRAEEFVHTFGDCAMLALYPPFLAASLQTSLTRPFANKRIRMALWIAASILFVSVFTTPLKVGANLLYVLLVVMFVYALVASIQAWRSATGAVRERARAFTVAFGLRDILWGFVYGGAIWLVWAGAYQVVESDEAAMGLEYILYPLGTLLAVPLIAYGILRTQLFDIDLRIRWTIKQSTLAGIFVALVYFLSEGADRFLSSELGSWAGLIASAIVVFFLAPLQRFAERVASAAMPNTKNTPEYTRYRKMQVYEAAVAEALAEGGITHKERALLARLRDSLEISAADAEALERDLAPEGLGTFQPT